MISRHRELRLPTESRERGVAISGRPAPPNRDHTTGRPYRIIGIYLASVLCTAALTISLHAQDTLPTDSTQADTTGRARPSGETRPTPRNVLTAPGDSVLTAPAALDTTEQATPVEPVISVGDTLIKYFSRGSTTFDVNRRDLYPRNAGGFISRYASYFQLIHHETPLRTIVLPFGLPGGGVTTVSGDRTISSYDFPIPADGHGDFDDPATGDVVSAELLEGPLSGFFSRSSGWAVLHLVPHPIAEGPAKSEFTVERGAFGYAYTRARIARLFPNSFGVAFSTDYRKGDGVSLIAGDDSYNVRTRIFKRLWRRTDLTFFADVYRRKGEFPVMPDSGGYTFARFRRDITVGGSLIDRHFLGGQFEGRFAYQSSRSHYSNRTSAVYRKILPILYDGELAYIASMSGMLTRISASGGYEKWEINDRLRERPFGAVTLALSARNHSWQPFLYARYGAARWNPPDIDGAVGIRIAAYKSWMAMASAGYRVASPNPVERFAPERFGRIGTSGSLADAYLERGNPDLKQERRLLGNVTIAFQTATLRLSLALNGGKIDDAIYYDRRFESFLAGEAFPANHQITFGDLNLMIELDTLGPFFATISATARKLDSDRFGARPPYSPRWQGYAQGGLRYTFNKYKVHLRLFGEISHSEAPYSYRLSPLAINPVTTGGINASLKAFTFYYMMHNMLNQVMGAPEGYGYSGWFYSWGINWKFLD